MYFCPTYAISILIFGQKIRFFNQKDILLNPACRCVVASTVAPTTKVAARGLLEALALAAMRVCVEAPRKSVLLVSYMPLASFWCSAFSRGRPWQICVSDSYNKCCALPTATDINRTAIPP